MTVMEIIPIGERINGVKVLRRTDKKVAFNRYNESVYECECMCGKTIYKIASMIISGAMLPCNTCRVKYNIGI